MVETTIRIKVIDGEVQLGAEEIKKLGRAIDDVEKKAKKVGGKVKESGSDIEKGFGKAEESVRNLNDGLEGGVKEAVKLTKAAKVGGAAMRSALIATGIGAFVVALGFIVSNWDAIGEALGFINKDLEHQKSLLKDNNDLLDIQLERLSLQKDILKLQGESTEDLVKQEKLLLEEKRKNILATIENLKLTIATEEAKAKELKWWQQIFRIPKSSGKIDEEERQILADKNEELEKQYNLLLKIEKQVLTPEKEAKEKKPKEEKNRSADILREAELSLLGERQREIREREERFQNDLLELKKAGITDLTAVELEYRQDLLAIDEQYRPSLESGGVADPYNEQKEKDALRLEALREGTEEFAIAQNEQIDLEVQGLIKSAEIQNRKTEDEKANADARVRIAEAEFQAKQMLLDGISGSLDAVSELVGRQTGAGKALAVASALIDTYASIAGQLRAFAGVPVPGYAIAQAVATGLAGFAAVKNILKVKVPYDKGGGSGSFAGGGGAGTTAAPSFNVVGTSGVNQLAQTLNQEQQPIQAFVVGGDVTSQQEFERNVVETSSI
jgi:hypothetical protein